jgi:hypothetical protein
MEDADLLKVRKFDPKTERKYAGSEIGVSSLWCLLKTPVTPNLPNLK